MVAGFRRSCCVPIHSWYYSSFQYRQLKKSPLKWCHNFFSARELRHQSCSLESAEWNWCSTRKLIWQLKSTKCAVIFIRVINTRSSRRWPTCMQIVQTPVAAPGGGMGGQMPPQLEALPPTCPPSQNGIFFFFFFFFFFFTYVVSHTSHQFKINISIFCNISFYK